AVCAFKPAVSITSGELRRFWCGIRSNSIPIFSSDHVRRTALTTIVMTVVVLARSSVVLETTLASSAYIPYPTLLFARVIIARRSTRATICVAPTLSEIPHVRTSLHRPETD
ncbi:unnamed protein product, partial [Laminaria digitata]